MASYGSSAISKTNLKLSFANLQLRQLNSLNTDSANRLLEQSLQESVCFHLVGAYIAFLREIADTYKVKAEITDLTSLKQGLHERGVDPVESRELAQLNLPGHWLERMLSRYERCWTMPSVDGPAVDYSNYKVPSEMQSVQIQLIDLAEDSASLSVNQELNQWISALKELVDRHRQTMQEW